jgi:ABC-2 type transport system permease protein
MKMIVKIAKNELRNLFYSPVAWFLAVIFMIVCGVFYSGALYKLALMQDVALRNAPKWKDFGSSLTRMVFLGNDGIFMNILNNLYLFIPLLTMGLISREINNGTVKLLYSSPVNVRQIVLGKYLAVMIYNLMLLSVVGIFIIMGIFGIRSVDMGLLFSSMLGFYLIVCTYSAIGMFMSSLSTYQIVSAISTFLLLFVLSRIGTLWQEYDLVRDLTYFLSINGRVMKMLLGLITTNDVMYFILISWMFIVFTMFRLKSSRQTEPWLKKAARYIAVFAVVLVVGYVCSRPGFIGYWDTTAAKLNTIGEPTQQILKSMEGEPLEVTLYSNLLGGGIHRTRPEHRNDFRWGLWEKFIRFKPDIKFNYVLYYDVMDNDSSFYKTVPGKTLREIAVEMARGQETNIDWYLEPKEIRKKIDLHPEKMRAVMHLKYKGRSMFLRTFDDATFWPYEDQVAAVLKRLAEGNGPKVYHTTGNLQRDIHKTGEREYEHFTIKKNSRLSLINHGYDFDTVNPALRDIPADATTLVIGDPKSALDEVATGHIKDYINKGGNLLVNGEPGKQQVVNPLIASTGAALMPGTIVEVTQNEMPQMVNAYWTYDYTHLVKAYKMDRLWKMIQGGDTARSLFPGVSPVKGSDSGFTIKHLHVTQGRNAWVKVGPLVMDSAAPVFTAAEGDYKQDSFDVTLALSRKLGNKEQRIIVAGDADYMSTLRKGTHNISKIYYSWLDYERYPVAIIQKTHKDVLLNTSLRSAAFQRILFVWILPAVVLALGTIILIRRKRQ